MTMSVIYLLLLTPTLLGATEDSSLNNPSNNAFSHESRNITMENFKILITLTKPYGMLVRDENYRTGNDRYEGFAVDIIKELSKELKFNYTFYLQEDLKNGKCKVFGDKINKKCKCDGMMGKIFSGEMDMAITDLTVTEDRQKCVEFSTAFWNTGISILFRKTTNKLLWAFTFVFALIGYALSYPAMNILYTSVLRYLLSRVSSAEWTIDNSYWLTIGPLVQQGSKVAPKRISLPTRTFVSFWQVLSLIIASFYTANLAAFLASEIPNRDFSGINDLLDQTRYKFGAKIGGSTFSYFESASDVKLNQLAKKMKSLDWAKYMVDDSEKGVELVENIPDYAFLMESSTIEYYQLRRCSVVQVGDLIEKTSYAMAYRKGFKYAKQISTTISILQKRLAIRELYDKWWYRDAHCFTDKDSNKAPAMSLTEAVGGILIPFVIGEIIIFAVRTA